MEVLKIIVIGMAAAALFSGVTYWWVRASVSDDLRARRHARAAEILLSLGMCGFWTVQVAKTHDWKLAILLTALVAGILVFRAARFLLKRRKQA